MYLHFSTFFIYSERRKNFDCLKDNWIKKIKYKSAKINDNAIESFKPSASSNKGYYYFLYEINFI